MSKVLRTLLANVEDNEKIELHPTRLATHFVGYICTREMDRMYAKHVWVPKAEGIDGLTIAMREAWKEIALCIANDAENDARNAVEAAKKKAEKPDA